MKFHVVALDVGECEVPAPEVFWMQGWDRWEPLRFHMLLAHNRDTNFLVNTGLPEDLSYRNQAMTAFAGARARFTRRDPVEALGRVGFTPEMIQNLSFTPLQDYTTGNLHRFTRATIFLSRRGWQEDIVAPRFAHHHEPELFLPRAQRDHLGGAAKNRIRFIETDQETELIPGIRTFWVGGHHRSSLAFVIDSDRGPVVFSDCAFTYANLERRTPIGIAENIFECWEAHDRMSQIGEVIPAYDPKVSRRFGPSHDHPAPTSSPIGPE